MFLTYPARFNSKTPQPKAQQCIDNSRHVILVILIYLYGVLHLHVINLELLTPYFRTLAKDSPRMYGVYLCTCTRTHRARI